MPNASKLKRSISAGVLVFRRVQNRVEVLLVHPGGPFWRNKDRGAWQIPKGLIHPGENAVEAAVREAQEELGLILTKPFITLGQIRQAGGKRVESFAVEQDFDTTTLVSNMFELEWPPRTGLKQLFPEVDRAQWFSLEQAREMMLSSQMILLDRLIEAIATIDPLSPVS